MLASIKKVLLVLVLVTVIAFAWILAYSQGRTYFNDEEIVGNTAGNIINGGLFCEKDGKIYFSNDNDDGALYVMNSDCTNIKKVHHDKAVFINTDENYIYYLRSNNTRENSSAGILMFNNTGLYRINRNGKNLKSISSNPGAYLSLKGNFVYYQNYDVNSGLFLYREQIDTKLERLLLEEAVIPSAIMDNRLYYAGNGKNHNINFLDLSSFVSSTYIEGNFAYPIFQGDYIYYLDLDNNYTVNRMKRDGSERTVLVDSRCSTYNITNSGQYLYYQIDEEENSKIGRLSLETMEQEVLLEGYYKQIHVTNNYVFFKDFDNTHTFIVSADGNTKLGTFDPPNLNENNTGKKK